MLKQYYIQVRKKMRNRNQINNRNTTFVEKLLAILEDQACLQYVEWIPAENGFNITNVTGFTQNVLPAYFKHQNYSSFVRQLNMYGFNKVRGREGDNIYEHKNFRRGNRSCIKKIQRKIGSEVSERNDEIVPYHQSLMVYNKNIQKQLQEINKLKEKQMQLQKKCLNLLQANKNLRQQNETIVKAIKIEEDKKKDLVERILTLLQSNQVKVETIEPDNGPFTGNLFSQNNLMEDDGNSINIKIYQEHEGYLSLDDFINIDYDQQSEGFKI